MELGFKGGVLRDGLDILLEDYLLSGSGTGD